ncbi:MAG: hypothetical protein Q9182_007474 [Xanthomendoza sp. 2 TL-2023]
MSENEASPAPKKQENNDLVPDDGFVAKWINYFHLALNPPMTFEEALQRKQARDKREEAADCAKCEKHRDFLLAYSPTVRFIRQNINKGSFNPSYGIHLCANHLQARSQVEDTIAHEMVHAYDYLRFNVDLDNNLRHAACSEIRAGTLSGECRWFREFWTNGQYKFTQHFQDCIRRRAVLSVAGRPGCKDDVQAAKVVNEVWDSCFSDTRPFDEVYR